MSRILLPVLACLVGLAVVFVLERPGASVDLAVADPPVATLAALVTAADLVVIGRVAQVESGRVVGRPDSAVRTQLATVLVDDVLVGDAGGVVVVEELSALSDGTPVTVAGVRPSRAGDAGVWFLTRGTAAELPYTSPMTPQGRFLLDETGRTLTASGDDELSRSLAELGPEGLAAAVREARPDGGPLSRPDRSQRGS